MRKIVEIVKSTKSSSTGEYVAIGFLGACRRLWHFWRHNGTHLDDYDEFRIRVLDMDKVMEGQDKK